MDLGRGLLLSAGLLLAAAPPLRLGARSDHDGTYISNILLVHMLVNRIPVGVDKKI